MKLVSSADSTALIGSTSAPATDLGQHLELDLLDLHEPVPLVRRQMVDLLGPAAAEAGDPICQAFSQAPGALEPRIDVRRQELVLTQAVNDFLFERRDLASLRLEQGVDVAPPIAGEVFSTDEPLR